MALGITVTAILGNLNLEFASVSAVITADAFVVKAPPDITGDNSYVAWWTNEIGNDYKFVE